ncbi:MAG: hypothetical protein MJ025_07075, partial [Victivallaceae bacterium]|nr:hypothetical protein [Victivallaceae bacterium]
GFELHLMVADGTGTCVVEFVRNRMNVMEDANVMTNYYLSLGWMTPHACGIERYDILGKHRDEGNSMEGMAKLMERVAFTKSYRLPGRTSDWVGYYEMLGADVTNENMGTWLEKLLPSMIQLNSQIRERMARKENPTGFWITMHMSVYDIARRQLRVIVQERYGEPYVFSLGK